MYRRIGVIFLILTLLTATACSSSAAAPDRIAKIMGEERRTEVAIAPDDPSVAGTNSARGSNPFATTYGSISTIRKATSIVASESTEERTPTVESPLRKWKRRPGPWNFTCAISPASKPARLK